MLSKSLLLFYIPLQLLSVTILLQSEALNHGLPFINEDNTW